MAFNSISIHQKARELLLSIIKGIENQIKELCVQHRTLSNPIINIDSLPPSSTYISSTLIFRFLLAYAIVLAIFWTDFLLLSDATSYFSLSQKNAAPIIFALIFLGMEIVILKKIYEQNFIDEDAENPSPKISPIPFLVIMIPVCALMAKAIILADDGIGSFIDDPSLILTYLPFLGIMLITHLGAIWMAKRGYLFQGLLLPIDLMTGQVKFRRKIEKATPNKVSGVENEISISMGKLLQRVKNYEIKFNPKVTGTQELNPYFLTKATQEEKKHFIYEPYIHSFTKSQINLIHLIMGKPIFGDESSMNLVEANPNPTLPRSSSNAKTIEEHLEENPEETGLKTLSQNASNIEDTNQFTNNQFNDTNKTVKP